MISDPQGGAIKRGFAPEEFADRLARAQALMDRHGFAALLLTTEPDVRYFSGFLTPFWQSPTRPWFLVVPAAGKPIAVIPEIGAECMARSWIDDIHTWPAPRPEDDGVTLLTSVLRKVAGAGTIAVAMGAESHLRMPLNDYARLRSGLGGTDFADATPVIRALRQIKSAAEIDKIAKACDAAGAAFDAVPEIISAGMSDTDAFRAFTIACLEAGADTVAYLVGGAGEGGYGDIISPPGARVLRAGDLFMLDTGCVFDGYFCDYDRNYALGAVAPEVERAHDAVYMATEAGLAAARPGATCAEVYAAMQKVLEAGGALGNAVGRLGHGLGMQLTEWPSFSAGDDTVIEPGMVLTLEPGMCFAPGRSIVHEENIVIHEDGAHLLTRRAPRTLPVIR